MPNLKAISFAAVNDGVEPTDVVIRTAVAPDLYREGHEFAFRSKEANDRRFKELTTIPSAVHHVAGKYLLDYAPARVFAGTAAPLRKREVDGQIANDYILEPADSLGERLVRSLDSFRLDADIEAQKAQWELRSFDWTREKLQIQNQLQYMMLEVSVENPTRATVFDVIHRAGKRKIGTLTFLFLPMDHDVKRGR
jgi:hypothetical protein